MEKESGLVEECIYDSSGHFQIDYAQAVKRYRLDLVKFDDVLLYLLQAAVACGATRVTVQHRPRLLTFEFDGTPAPSREFAGILNWFSEKKDASRHRLCMAALACLAPAGPGCSLDLPDGSRVLLRKQGAAVAVELSTHPDTLPGVRVCIPTVRRWFGWARKPSYLKPLVERGSFAPLEIYLNGRRLAPSFGQPLRSASWSIFGEGSVQGPQDLLYASDHHLLESRRPCTEQSGRLNLPWPGDSSHCLDFKPDSGFYSRAAMARRFRERPELTVVQYGVAMRLATKPALAKHLWLVVAEDDLETDASCLQLVNSPRLESLLDEQMGYWQGLYQPPVERHSEVSAEAPFHFWLAETRPALPPSQRLYRS